MKKSIEIVAIEKVAGDVFTKVEWKEDGETRQETISIETLIDLAKKGIEIGYDVENEELENAIAETGIEYAEIDSPLSDDEEGFDVYLHEAIIEDGEVVIDIEGNLLKRYKTEKGAVKFANQITKIVLK